MTKGAFEVLWSTERLEVKGVTQLEFAVFVVAKLRKSRVQKHQSVEITTVSKNISGSILLCLSTSVLIFK